MKPNHTPGQRRRLFALARLLDRVPRSHFNMAWWIQQDGLLHERLDHLEAGTTLRSCKTAACACGWALTLPSIRSITSTAYDIPREAFGMDDEKQKALFGDQRKVGPKQVASEIRLYLKDGTLP